MDSKIEKMNRMRKIILKGFLLSWVTLGIWLFHFTLISVLRLSWRIPWIKIRPIQPYLEGLWIVGVILLAIYILFYLVFKYKLMRDPSVKTAVNDERVRLNWLKAFRIAFYTLLFIAIVWKWYETGLGTSFLHMKIRLVQTPYIIWFGSILALIVSFLHYDKDVKEVI